VSYQWRYQDDAGADVAGPSDQFDSKADAESWIAGHWLSLRRNGVKRVLLLEDGAEVGQPMVLEEA
jgi:hypothetical protein